MKQVTRIFDLLDNYPVDQPDLEVFASRSGKNWEYTLLKDYQKESKFLARALIASLEKGDRIATVSNNRPEWNIVDMASALSGMVHVPIYPTINLEEFRYILIHSGAKFLFVSDYRLYRKLNPLVDEINTLEGIFSFDHINDCRHWMELMLDKGNIVSQSDLIERSNSIASTDLFTLIYTSGTTGQPKGVMLSHANIIANIKAAKDLFPMENGDRALSILPLCHITERMVNYLYQFTQIKIFYAKGFDSILSDLQDSRAHGFVTVPRVLEKILEKIQENAAQLSRQKRWVFNWAMFHAERYEIKHSARRAKRLARIDKRVFVHWRKALGGPKKFIACGGASLDPRVLKVFLAAGFPIHEGYGMTETAPLVSINHFNEANQIRIGSLGKTLPSVQARISDEGEIQIKGPNLMMGYFRNEEKTKETIDENGWFSTGDLGEIDPDGFIWIKGRKKELFKTSGGKYIAPLAIENVFTQSSLIDNILVVGENQKFPGAIILPNYEYLADWARNQKIKYKKRSDLIKAPKVLKAFEKEISRLNKRLGKTEQIKEFRLVKDDWSIPTGELSPTLKVRRTVVAKKYEKLTRSIYRPPKKRQIQKKTNRDTN